MPSAIRFHYGPFIELDHPFGDHASIVRSSPCAFSGNVRQQSLATFRPRLDLHESEDSNVVTATFELPEFTSEDVTINVQRNRLTISGESTSSTSREDEHDGYTVRERHRGKFVRTLRLPFGTKPEDVEAKMENGLLTVTFPKEVPGKQPQRIAIH